MAAEKWDRSPERVKADLEIARLIYNDLTPKQKALIDDESRRRGVCCPRRAGKTTAAVAQIFICALTIPNANIGYLWPTKEQARKQVWEHPDWDSLKNMAAKYGVKATFNDTRMVCRLSNGSMISMFGLDRRKDIDKCRGGKFHLFIIDECGTLADSLLSELVMDAMRHTMADFGGTMQLQGSPGPLRGSFFYRTCPWTMVENDGGTLVQDWDPNVKGYLPFHDRDDERWIGRKYAWTAHRFTVQDNTAMPHIWEHDLADKEALEVPDDDPGWLREKHGVWTIDHSLSVFEICAANRWDDVKIHPKTRAEEPALPVGPDFAPHKWHYMLGIYLARNAKYGLSVVACSETHPVLHHVETQLRKKFSTISLGREIQSLEKRYGQFYNVVARREGGGGAVFGALAHRYDVFVEVEKEDQRYEYDLVDLMRADLEDERCCLRDNDPLEREMSLLHWTPDRKRFSDDCETAAIRSFLHLWDRSVHILAELPVEPLKPGSPEWYDADNKRQFDAAVDRRTQAEDEKELWEESGDGIYDDDEGDGTYDQPATPGLVDDYDFMYE